MSSYKWCSISNVERAELISKLFLYELKTFHFNGINDNFINNLIKSCIDNISIETKEHIGRHLDIILNAYSLDSKHHTVPSEFEQLLPQSILKIDNKVIELTQEQKGYIRHMLHAICNNIVLVMMIFSSTLHSIIPGIQPFWCVDRLIQMFLNMRLHTGKDVLSDRYSAIINNMKYSQESSVHDDNRRDLGYALLQSLVKEKDILEEMLPDNIPDWEMKKTLDRLLKYHKNRVDKEGTDL